MTRPGDFKAENETAWQKKVIEEKKEGRQHTIEELISKGQHFFQAEDFGSALEVYTHGIENVSKVKAYTHTRKQTRISDWHFVCGAKFKLAFLQVTMRISIKICQVLSIQRRSKYANRSTLSVFIIHAV